MLVELSPQSMYEDSTCKLSLGITYKYHSANLVEYFLYNIVRKWKYLQYWTEIMSRVC